MQVDPINSCKTAGANIVATNCSLLPDGTAEGYASHNRTTEECLTQAYDMVRAECTKAVASYTSDPQSEQLCDEVHKITALVRVLSLVSVKQPQARVVTPVDKQVEELTQKFSGVVIDVEKAAREAFMQQNLETAKQLFLKLSTLHKHEKGTDRDHYISACSFATDVQSCRVEELLLRLNGLLASNSQNLKRLNGIVEHFTGLQVEGYPASLKKWRDDRIKVAICDYIKQQEQKTKDAVKSIWKEILDESNKVQTLLTAEKLQGIKFYTLLNDLRPILVTLERLSAELDTSISVHNQIAVHFELFEIPNGANHQDVVRLVKEWKELATSAIELLSDLSKVESTEEKNSVLITWIEKNIEAYNCKADKLSALHSWAFTLLGKLFTSQELTQESLNASIGLIRKHPKSLLTHSRALLRDVQLQFGNERKAMNHLLLGVISGVLQTSSCTVEKVSEFHSTWQDFPCIGHRIERARTWLRGEQHIDVNLGVYQEEEVTVFTTRAKVMNDLLEALQNNDFAPLAKLSHDEVVALFENTSFLLEMPEEIVMLSINNLDTPVLRKSLNAFLWLRFAQARKVELPYTDLQALFKPLNKDNFIKWISFYNQERITQNPKNHHMLFTAIAGAANRLLVEESVRLSDEEIVKIINFIAARYTELITPNVNPAEKLRLDTQLVLLMALALAKAKNRELYYDLEVLNTIDSLRTGELNNVKNSFNENVVSWLEEAIYPRIRRLELTHGLATSGLGNFLLCTNLTGLAMPFPEDQASQRLQEFAKVATQINTLQLFGGQIDPEVFNSFPHLTHLSLQNIGNTLDFSRCTQLRKTAINLDFQNVWIAENSLSWVASCEQLASLSIKANENCIIGSLADEVCVHTRHAFATLALDITSFDQDPQLIASLPKLLQTFQTLSDVTLKGAYSKSLLAALLEGRDQDSQLTTCKLTWNEGADLSVLSSFKCLEILHCYISDPNLANTMSYFVFDSETALKEWQAISLDGLTSTTIQINRRQ